MIPSVRLVVIAAAAWSGLPTEAQTGYTHFEARQTHPIELSTDGSRLFALNSPDSRLSVFDVSNPLNPSPVLLAEIPVGLEPVAVRQRTADEVWVVNEVSDSISVVSLSRQTVVATLNCPDEPGDVVFAGNQAFVTCSRNNAIRVFDAGARQEIGFYPVQGLYPRSLAVNAAGTKVYAAFLLSGNGTTVLPASTAPDPPAPTNASLPPAPKTGLIVPTGDPRVPYTVLDHDVVEFDTATRSITRYFDSLGTNLFDIAVHPVDGHLWVPHTEARNLVRFEPALRGHFVDHRLAWVADDDSSRSQIDLNPGVDYGQLPNPSAQGNALAQPTALAWAPDGQSAWLAAFGSDRVAKIDASGTVTARIDVRLASPNRPADTRHMRGPRGLALDASRHRLFVLNKLANTISLIDTATGAVQGEIPVGSFDPMPAPIREGRGFLFDARLSGNGLGSCAVCHLDADRDGLAWDLGDPGGSMQTVIGYNLAAAHANTPIPRELHPMKGPMLTQTLRGMSGNAPFHWRGDRATLQDFNGTFPNLMAGPALSQADIDALAAYLLTLRHHANPNRKNDRTLQTSLAGGNPNRGRDLYNLHNNHCIICHILPNGTDNNLDSPPETGSTQPMKNPSLRLVYQRDHFDSRTGKVNITGYGLGHDGTLFGLPTAHPYVLDELGQVNFADFADVSAFVLSFDTGTAPAVGLSRTATTENASSTALSTDLALLENQARVTNTADLAVHGILNGRRRQFFYDKTIQAYRSERSADALFTRGSLLALIASPTDTLTFMGTLPGDGRRLGGDRNADGLLDGDDPLPPLLVLSADDHHGLRWPADRTDWVLESSASLTPPWEPVTAPLSTTGTDTALSLPVGSGPAGPFFRLRRTW